MCGSGVFEGVAVCVSFFVDPGWCIVWVCRWCQIGTLGSVGGGFSLLGVCFVCGVGYVE